jgi:hypothetical protein
MNKDDIIRMALEAGTPITPEMKPEDALAIAFALGKAEERKRIESRPWGAGEEWIARAVAAEREACAKVCENIKDESGVNDDGSTWLRRTTKTDCAAAIRARGQQ